MKKIEKQMTVNGEQFNWIMTFQKTETDLVLGLMKTGVWHLIWKEEEHAYVLMRTDERTAE